MHSRGLKSISIGIPRIILFFLAIDVGLCIANIANKLVGQPYDVFTVLLDLNSETSLASWYSSIQLFCVFLLSAVFAYDKYKTENKLFPMIWLPIVFLLMSIDETCQIHEWLGNESDNLLPGGSRVGTSFEKTGIWMFVLGLPFLVFFFMCARSLKSHFSEKPWAFKKLVIGMIVMLIGALGFEALSNIPEYGKVWAITVIIEEGLEMIGVTIMLWSMYEMSKDCFSFSNRSEV